MLLPDGDETNFVLLLNPNLYLDIFKFKMFRCKSKDISLTLNRSSLKGININSETIILTRRSPKDNVIQLTPVP